MNASPHNSKTLIAAAVLTVLFASGCERRTPDAASGAPSEPASTSNAPSTTPSTAPSADSTAPATPVPASGDTSSDSKSAGTVLDDTVTTTKVKTALLADSDIKGLEINVETSKGVVSLNGAVNNQAQIDRAVKVAADVQGVNSVINNLTIKK
jgi:hyperosmotically inducible protein